MQDWVMFKWFIYPPASVTWNKVNSDAHWFVSLELLAIIYREEECDVDVDFQSFLTLAFSDRIELISPARCFQRTLHGGPFEAGPFGPPVAQQFRLSRPQARPGESEKKIDNAPFQMFFFTMKNISQFIIILPFRAAGWYDCSAVEHPGKRFGCDPAGRLHQHEQYRAAESDQQ